jgi:hypothetical protein
VVVSPIGRKSTTKCNVLSRHLHEGTEKNYENLCQNSRCHNRDSKWELQENTSEFCLLIPFYLFGLLFDPEMTRVHSSETSIKFYGVTRRHIPERSALHDVSQILILHTIDHRATNVVLTQHNKFAPCFR